MEYRPESRMVTSAPDEAGAPEGGFRQGSPMEEGGTRRARKRISMHEGIAVWCDCCSCAAEPYWLEVAEELGIDLGSDYEE